MELWSTEHIAVLGLTAALCVVAGTSGRTLAPTSAAALSRALAVVVGAAFITDHVTAAILGEWSLRRYLPLHLSDVATIVTVLALWRPRPLLVELTYFWGLTASLQATLTPNLGHTYPDVLFFTFFITHAGVVIAAALLVAGRRLGPRGGAVGRVFLATLVVAGAAAIGTVLTGGNYMYLREKPSESLLDVMGPWPWYIATSAVLAITMFVVLDAPFRGRRGGRM
jgi:hypothetical integral membrane protein (TIGR02206 family)